MRLMIVTLFLQGFLVLGQSDFNPSMHAHVYQLPFEADKTVLIMQGYNGTFSHKNKFALDFRLRKGRIACAARGGKVIKVVEHNSEGGANIKYIHKANYVVIAHGDGTYGGYWHLMQDGAIVEVGDEVKTGDPIGKSGSTGFSSMPHLHFMVYGYDQKGVQYTLPTKFHTRKKGAKYLSSYSFVGRP